VSIIITLLGGCGYKPSAKYAREVLADHISTDVVISAQDPENTVFIKDAVDKALIEVFHASLTTPKYADTHLVIKLQVPKYIPIQYDTSGFVIAYRARIILFITRKSKDIVKHYRVQGTYNFDVSPNAVLTDQERYNAIKFGSIKAIESFLAQVSAEGVDNSKEKIDDY